MSSVPSDERVILATMRNIDNGWLVEYWDTVKYLRSFPTKKEAADFIIKQFNKVKKEK